VVNDHLLLAIGTERSADDERQFFTRIDIAQNGTFHSGEHVSALFEKLQQTALLHLEFSKGSYRLVKKKKKRKEKKKKKRQKKAKVSDFGDAIGWRGEREETKKRPGALICQNTSFQEQNFFSTCFGPISR
jgi:hypothetical protein